MILKLCQLINRIYLWPKKWQKKVAEAQQTTLLSDAWYVFIDYQSLIFTAILSFKTIITYSNNQDAIPTPCELQLPVKYFCIAIPKVLNRILSHELLVYFNQDSTELF